jgi:hypothetical protein
MKDTFVWDVTTRSRVEIYKCVVPCETEFRSQLFLWLLHANYVFAKVSECFRIPCTGSYSSEKPPLGKSGVTRSDFHTKGTVKGKQISKGITVWTQLYCRIRINISTTCFGSYGHRQVRYSIGGKKKLHNIIWYSRNIGDRGSTVVKVLCYNSESRWFDPSYCQWIFIDINSFCSHYGPGVDSASNRNEYQEYFLGVKTAGA